MQALNVALTAQVSLTLLEESGGWRFGSWEQHDGTLLPQPPEAACKVQFPSPLAAADFFRTIYAMNLTKQ